MSDFEKKLAELIFAYFTAPFGGEFDDRRERARSRRTWDDHISKWAEQPHAGDCTQQCHTCLRCLADRYLHMTRWIAERLDHA